MTDLLRAVVARFRFLLRVPVILAIGHVYVALRLAGASGDPSWRWSVLGALVLLYALLMVGFRTRHGTGRRAADAIAWAAFLFLGLFSWLFVFTLLRDVVLIVVHIVSSFSPVGWATSLILPSAAIVPAVAVLATLLGVFNARREPAVVHCDIVVPGLASALNGFTFAQITDLHVGPTIKQGFVRRVVKLTNGLMPDVIVLTGDLVDGRVAALREHTQPLSDLRAPHGVYGVTGNHEYYSGALEWVDEFRRLGIVMLMNEHVVLSHQGARLVLAGVTDFGAKAFESSHATDPARAMRNSPGDATVRVLLAHQPRSLFAAADAGFDVQLSGHTHGGQFWPWRYFVPLQQPLVAGLHRRGPLQVYVSQGTGYWGPPQRMGARSEVSLIRLRRATRAPAAMA